MTKRLLIIGLALFIPFIVHAQTNVFPAANLPATITGQWTFSKPVVLTPTTVSGLPAAATVPGGLAAVTNGASVTDCVAGGGTTFVVCKSNGTVWSAVDTFNPAVPGTIGGTTPAAITGTTITANTGFVGPLTGNVTGNVSGSAATATTAANLSGTPALPNGTTATTQTSSDNTTKLATDAFVQANVNPFNPASPGPIGGTTPAAGAFTTVTSPNVNGYVYLSAALGASCADQTTAIQAAINSLAALKANTLIFPPGCYGFTQLTLPEGVKLQGPGIIYYNETNTATLRGLAANSMIVASAANQAFNAVDGFIIDGQNTATAGIFFDTVIRLDISYNNFINFAFGSTAISGSSELFAKIQWNSFSVAGYAMDFQNSYGTIHAGYGINVGDISNNEFDAAEGVRVSGITDFENNDFEATMTNATSVMLDICEAASVGTNNYATISHNYWELGGPTTPATEAMRICAGTGIIKGNSVYGHSSSDAGSTAVDGVSGVGYSLGLDISGNEFANWALGVNSFCTAVGRQGCSIDTNYYNNVTTPGLCNSTGWFNCYYQNQTAVATTPPTQSTASGLTQDPLHGYLVGTAIVPSTVYVSSTATVLDLSLGNTFQLAYAAPKTITGFQNWDPNGGNEFCLWVANGTPTTLDNSATDVNGTFKLAAAANVTLSGNTPVCFVVDYTTQQAWEVGSATRQMQLADTPPTVASNAGSGSLTDGTDAVGIIATGAASTASTLTFGIGWSTWASCTVNASTATAQPYVSAISKSAVTFTYITTGTPTLYYQCGGQ